MEAWKLSEEGLKQGLSQQQLLNTDLKLVGAPVLPSEIGSGRIDEIEGPCVLQVAKVKNLSAPSDNQESKAFPRMLRVQLTDGHTKCEAIELETIPGISLQTAPGTKLLFSQPKTQVKTGFIVMTPGKVKCLGGRVDALYDRWKLQCDLAFHDRSTSKGTGGPPRLEKFSKEAVQRALQSQKDRLVEKKAPAKAEKVEESEELERAPEKSTTSAYQAFHSKAKADNSERLAALQQKQEERGRGRKGGRGGKRGRRGRRNDDDEGIPQSAAALALSSLTDMGFPIHKAQQAISRYGIDDLDNCVTWLSSDGKIAPPPKPRQEKEKAVQQAPAMFDTEYVPGDYVMALFEDGNHYLAEITAGPLEMGCFEVTFCDMGISRYLVPVGDVKAPEDVEPLKEHAPYQQGPSDRQQRDYGRKQQEHGRNRKNQGRENQRGPKQQRQERDGQRRDGQRSDTRRGDGQRGDGQRRDGQRGKGSSKQQRKDGRSAQVEAGKFERGQKCLALFEGEYCEAVVASHIHKGKYDIIFVGFEADGSVKIPEASIRTLPSATDSSKGAARPESRGSPRQPLKYSPRTKRRGKQPQDAHKQHEGEKGNRHGPKAERSKSHGLDKAKYKAMPSSGGDQVQQGERENQKGRGSRGNDKGAKGRGKQQKGQSKTKPKLEMGDACLARFDGQMLPAMVVNVETPGFVHVVFVGYEADGPYTLRDRDVQPSS